MKAKYDANLWTNQISFPRQDLCLYRPVSKSIELGVPPLLITNG